jgi:hypothetical protein
LKVQVIEEEGYLSAAYGLSLSYNSTIERAKEIMPKLALQDGGHNKFTESIIVWIVVDAPRYFWSQGDTYRISSKQSESTMHTILKRPLTQEDFEEPIYETTLEGLNADIENKDFDSVKNNLPEGFLQRRVWCLSYKTLRNICHQRQTHKLKQWQYFIKEVKSQVQYPEFLE